MKTYQEFIDLNEKFSDLGKLTPEQLKKGQVLSQDDDNFIQVTSRVFYKAVSAIRDNDIAKGDKARGLATLTVYKIPEYDKMKCYLGKNNSSGYAIAHGTELVSVFSSQGSSGDAIVVSAIENGATHLDCFAIRKEKGIEGSLYKLYSRHGFKIDTSMNSGKQGEPYAIVKGVSSFVDDNEKVHEDDPRVVIFMKL
ncbi:MAG: hypothetical protein WC679_00515 [Bacteroidales bacterium]|jgi:hypothetical protein